MALKKRKGLGGADLLRKILSDGECHSPRSLVRKTGIKNTRSLKSTIHWLRTMGHEIKSVNIGGHSKYQMIIFKRKDEFWPCMLSKEEWKMCYGQGCHNKLNCGAVPNAQKQMSKMRRVHSML